MDLILDVKIFIASLNKEAWLNLYVVDNEFQKYAKLESSITLYIKLFQVHIECDEYIDYPLFDGKYSYRKHKIAMAYSYNNMGNMIEKDSEAWYKYDLLHRDGDLPALISNRSQEWYKDGIPHREDDLPAFIFACGFKSWYKNGKRHRDGDLPAITRDNGYQCWYKDNKLHREYDLPAIIRPDGTLGWYLEGKCI